MIEMPKDDQFMQDLEKLVCVSDDHVVMAILDRLIISSSKLGQWQELMYKAQTAHLRGQTFGYSTPLSSEPPRGKAICGDG